MHALLPEPARSSNQCHHFLIIFITTNFYILCCFPHPHLVALFSLQPCPLRNSLWPLLFFNLYKQKEYQCKRVRGQLDFKFFLLSSLSYRTFLFVSVSRIRREPLFLVILVSLINDIWPLIQIFENVCVTCRDTVESHCLGAMIV